MRGAGERSGLLCNMAPLHDMQGVESNPHGQLGRPFGRFRWNFQRIAGSRAALKESAQARTCFDDAALGDPGGRPRPGRSAQAIARN